MALDRIKAVETGETATLMELSGHDQSKYLAVKGDWIR